MIKVSSQDSLQQWLFVEHNTEKTKWESNEVLPVTISGKKELKEQVLKCIDEAVYYIKICSFIFTDNDIVQSLSRKLEATDVALFILTQLDQSKFSSSFLTEEEVDENPSKVHLKSILNLYDRGAHVRAADSVHAKFLIVDGKTALVTSANITTPSLNTNPESGVYLDSNSLKDASTLFDLFFKYCAPYRSFDKARQDKRYVVQGIEELDAKLLPAGEHGLIYTLDASNNSLYQEIVKVINNAERYLLLSSYCITVLERLPEFLESIKNALSRNVSIKVFCRGMNYRSDHLNGVKILAELGCHVFGDLLNHSKGISNEKESIIFTANIDGRHGLIDGFEVGVRLDAKQNQAMNDFMNWQISNSLYKLRKNPTRNEVFITYETYCALKNIRPPHPFEKLFIMAEGLDDKAMFALENQAFYGIYENQQLIAIELGGNFYSAHPVRNAVLIKRSEKNYRNSEKYLIRFKSLIVEYE